MLGLVWDLYQSHRIGQLNQRVNRTQQDLAAEAASRREILHLEGKVDRLALICRAMCELLEPAGITDQQLSAKITEIDLRDGERDGKMTPTPKRCPKCDAMMSPQFGRCLFCGHTDGDLPHP